MGIISEVGSGVTLLKKGDRVVLPFNVADGRCWNCEEGNTAFCTGVNPGFAGGGTPLPPPVSRLISPRQLMDTLQWALMLEVRYKCSVQVLRQLPKLNG